MIEAATMWIIEDLSVHLKSRGLFLCMAESCTGGLASKMCTDLPGSSEWFAGGVITYSNMLKTSLLGVPAGLIAELGAVSLEVVRGMAVGGIKACAADCALAFSGIAGPEGGSVAKPVGMVCIAVALPGTVCGKDESLYVQAYTRHFNGNRQDVRLAAVMDGLETLLGLFRAC